VRGKCNYEDHRLGVVLPRDGLDSASQTSLGGPGEWLF